MARPRSYDDDTRIELIDAAATLLAREGVAGLSVRAVAEAVGATTSAIYGLFGSKAGLVQAMFAAGFAALDAELDRVPITDDPWADIQELGLAYRRSAVARPHLYQVMFGQPVPEFVPGPDEAAVAARTLDRLHDAVARAAARDGLAGDLDVDRATVGTWARAHGLASLELAGFLGDDAEATWRATMRADHLGWRASASEVSAREVSAPG
ncbi:TetR/AcrR family transcriptional regulator [Nitriliruptoraceae bacterium ZYF776]|nr:TetR/AcrR family transcriptional regulator [Profundirhabdus halotolerans]